MRVRVSILGPLLVWSAKGAKIEVAGARLRALLVRLALDSGRIVGVETLVGDLWGESPPADAVNSLQSLVSRLRRALPHEIGSVPAGYRLEVRPDEIDVHHFERLAGEGRRLLGAGDNEQAAAVLLEAVKLWRGPALADVQASSFALAPAARLSELRDAAVEDRIEADLRLGRHAEVVAELEALVADHPLRERLRGQQMRALYGAGRQADALAVYVRTQRALEEELGVSPSPELEAVHLAVLRGDPALTSEPAVIRANAQPRTNLRAQITTFVGREKDIDGLAGMLTESRLVTLVGSGGSGKTRLAVEAAARLTDRFPGGVWLAELASLRDPADLPQAVLVALGAGDAVVPDQIPVRRESGGSDTMSRLVSALAGKSLLLVLDNCEHLIGAAARLADKLLADCPRLVVLATSREPVGINGETLFAVPPLDLPQEGSPAADMLTAPAVRLFADRASAVRTGFTVHENNVDLVVQICRRLDGMPLAIELAAARIRSLPVDQVATLLSDRFRLLTGGSRVSLPRHRTLRAVVDWSWELLSEPERILTRRLAVFPGGATLEGAEQVCSDDGLRRGDVLDLLAALVDKSLLEVTGEAEWRYRMLETVRAYATERLVQADESAVIHARHAEYFLAFAERADPLLRTGEQITWLAKLLGEQDNLLAAVRWALDERDAVPAVRLVVALSWFWLLTHNGAQAAPLLTEVLSMPDDAYAEVPPDILALAHGFRALHAEGAAPFDTVVRLSGQLDRSAGHPLVGLLQAIVGGYQRFSPEDPVGTAAGFAGGLDDPDPWVRACVRLARGLTIAELEADPAIVESDFAEALAGFEAVGDRWGISMAAGGLADVCGRREDYAGAVAARELAVRLLIELAAHGEAVEEQIRLGMERVRAGDLAGARVDLAQALDATRRSGDTIGEAYALGSLAEVDHLTGDFAAAQRSYHLALANLDAGSDVPQLRARLLVGLGRLAAADTAMAEAEAFQRQALAFSAGGADRALVAAAIDGLAEAAFGRGDAERAATLLGAAVAVRGLPDLTQPGITELADAVRERLGGPAYEDAYLAGSTMTRQAALSYAGRVP